VSGGGASNYRGVPAALLSQVHGRPETETVQQVRGCTSQRSLKIGVACRVCWTWVGGRPSPARGCGGQNGGWEASV